MWLECRCSFLLSVSAFLCVSCCCCNFLLRSISVMWLECRCSFLLSVSSFQCVSCCCCVAEHIGHVVGMSV